MYGSCDRPNDANRYVMLGFLVFPEDPHLYTTRGILIEVRLRAILADWRQGGDLTVSRRRNSDEVLKAAAMQFRHALAIANQDAEARLHLGWGLLFLGDKRATAELDAALSTAPSDTIRYLAHLFLGGLAERENRLSDAAREYENARALGAGFQTPYVALSRIEHALGHVERARELAAFALQLAKTDDDPWWDHRIGFDRESLTWLRAEVRTQ
jgi:tetratricopeptide (TPR) repeat protein